MKKSASSRDPCSLSMLAWANHTQVSLKTRYKRASEDVGLSVTNGF